MGLLLLGAAPDAQAQPFQVDKMLASDGETQDRFASALDVDRDWLAVGSPNDDDLGNDTGAVYLFEWDEDSASWIERQKLTPADLENYDSFGFAVALQGDVLVVGVPDKGVVGPGLAYVFERDRSSGLWVEVAQLVPPHGRSLDRYGYSVAVSGRRIAIGDYPLQGVGSVYLYVRAGGAWELEQRIRASDAAEGSAFSFSVALEGDTLAVGAWGRDVGGLSNAGSVYVFELDDATGRWNEVALLTASDAGAIDNLGYSVALTDGRLVAGATGDDDLGLDAGAAYVFERSEGGEWSEVAKLLGSGSDSFDRFGHSVAIRGSLIAVGAPDSDLARSVAGVVHFFRRRDAGGVTWDEITRWAPSDLDPFGDLGYWVAMSAGRIAVGNRFDDDLGVASGAAYVISR